MFVSIDDDDDNGDLDNEYDNNDYKVYLRYCNPGNLYELM